MTDSTASKKLIGEYTPDEIRRSALQWFDLNSDQNLIFPYITKMLMRIGVAKELNIDAPAAVTIYNSEKNTPRIRLHVSPSKMQEMSPNSGIEIAPWCLGHEMAHIIYDHLKFKAEDVPFIAGDESLAVNDKIFLHATECACNDIFESIGLEAPVDKNGENPLIMGSKTPGLMRNSYPLDTIDIYSEIADNYEKWKEEKEKENSQKQNSDGQNSSGDSSDSSKSQSSSSDNSDSSTGSSSSGSSGDSQSDGSNGSGDSSNSEDDGSNGSDDSQSDDSSGSSSPDDSDDSQSDDSNSSGDSQSDDSGEEDGKDNSGKSGADSKYGDMSIFNQDEENGYKYCQGTVFVDENGNPINPDDVKKSNGSTKVYDFNQDAINEALDSILSGGEKEDIQDILNGDVKVNNGEDEEKPQSNSLPQQMDGQRNQSQTVDNTFDRYDSYSRNSITIPIDDDIIRGYDWSSLMTKINPVFATASFDFGNNFALKHDWSRHNPRLSNVCRKSGSIIPDRNAITGDMVYSLDSSIYLDLSPSMGSREIMLSAMCYYILSQVVGEKKVKFYTFSSSCVESDVEITHDSVIIHNPVSCCGTSFHSIVEKSVQEEIGNRAREMDIGLLEEYSLKTNKLILVVSDMYAQSPTSMTKTNLGKYKFIGVNDYDEYQKDNFNFSYGENNMIYLSDYES